MYWDVVEVAPGTGYSLFVRFQDGLEGSIDLRHESLTGALEPLRNENFFGRPSSITEPSPGQEK
jgi:hypothetical protein